MPCHHFRVTGIVQGVFFRASTQEQGQQLGLRGWVRNMPDGAVEALACGDDDRLDQFEQWIKHGPPMARVEQLETKTVNMEIVHERFEIIY